MQDTSMPIDARYLFPRNETNLTSDEPIFVWRKPKLQPPVTVRLRLKDELKMR